MGHRRKFNSPNLLKSLVRLIRKKQAMWRRGKIAGDFIAYKRNEARFAIRQFHNFEKSLLQTGKQTSWKICQINHCYNEWN